MQDTGFAHDGGPVGFVLSHGFTGNLASIRPWAEHLAAAGFSVRAPLLPGHGTSWQDANRTRWPQWYAAVDDAYSELAAGCSQVIAGGLSMGGTLVTRLAEQRPLAGLVLVNPSYATERKDAWLAKYVAWALRSKAAIGGDIKKPGASEASYSRTPLAAFVSLQQLWAVTRADMGAIRCPVRVYRSTVDHVVEPLSVRLLKENATATTVEEVLLHDSFHVATLDNDAPLIFEGSVEFARSLS